MNQKRVKSEEYRGFKVSRDEREVIDILDFKSGSLTTKNGSQKVKIDRDWFWDNYVNPRKPVLLKNANSIDLEAFKWDQIANTLDGDDLLQVEELEKGGFGSGKKRLKMTFGEFKKRVDNDECLYMTTQYEEPPSDDNEGDELIDDFEDDFNEELESQEEEGENQDEDQNEEEEEGESNIDLEEIYQPPLDFLVLEDKTSLLKPIPFDILQGYSPQQVNLWMGVCDSTTLKYDLNEDNQIVNVNKGLPSNGTSSGLHHDHADNLYTLVEGEKTFSIWSPDCGTDFYTVGDIRTIYSSGIIDYIRNEKSPNWKPLNERGMQLECSDDNAEGDESVDPPSFSAIPPVLLHLEDPETNIDAKLKSQLKHYLQSKFPLASELVGLGMRVKLTPGDCLFLPAGWFHEVSSYQRHIAVNHWFHIPQLPQ